MGVLLSRELSFLSAWRLASDRLEAGMVRAQVAVDDLSAIRDEEGNPRVEVEEFGVLSRAFVTGSNERSGPAARGGGKVAQRRPEKFRITQIPVGPTA